MPSFKTQQEVPCFMVWLTKSLMLAPCGMLGYNLMWIASLIGFFFQRCATKTVWTTVPRFALARLRCAHITKHIMCT